MKIAVLQLNCNFADIESNMKKIRDYIMQAAQDGFELILLPEFFPSAIGFSPEMDVVALKGVHIQSLLKKWSDDFNIIIGGSYLCFDGSDCHNTFDLIFPDGSVFSHQKDLPTQFENCYYTKGDIDHVLHTPIGNIGVALCWEMLRFDTVKRLLGKVDFVLSGSCWWDLPLDAPKNREPLRAYNQALAIETPVTFAKLLRVPVVHACHCGHVRAYNFPEASKVQTRQFVGATQILDNEGCIVARRIFYEGEGLVTAEVDFGKTQRQKDMIEENRHWIPDLPEAYLKAWNTINPVAEVYYREKMLPRYKAMTTQIPI